MKIDFPFILVALKAAIHYIPTTLVIAFVPLLLGMVFGLIIAIIRFYNVPVIAKVLKYLVTIIKGIPVVLMLLVAYLMASDLFDKLATSLHWSLRFKDVNRGWIGIFVLTIVATVGLSEIFRGALAAIKPGQFDAAYAIGLTKRQTLRRIIIPQVFPIALPMITSLLIGLVKASALVSMISVVDVLNGALITATGNYNFLEAYIAAAIIYWAISIIIERLSGVAEKSFIKRSGRVLS